MWPKINFGPRLQAMRNERLKVNLVFEIEIFSNNETKSLLLLLNLMFLLLL